MNWRKLPDGRSYLPPGTILKFEYQGGCYKILDDPIGYGGAGILYPAIRVIKKEGHWEEDGMWVALKECYPHSTDGMLERNDSGEIRCVGEKDAYFEEYYASAKAMMRREKEITGQVFNRGFRLTPLWDIVEQEEISLDGETFQRAENQYGIMERLDEKGTSLGKILKEQQGGCLTAYQSVCILGQILQALEEVHDTGYLHGDIQENNIFLKGTDFSQDEEGMVTLIDFGSAKELLADGATAMITDKKLYSTSGYSAPECMTGNDGTLRLTMAADIYSVGYLMLRMLVGKAMDTKALQLVVNGKYLYPRQAKKIGCPSASIDAINKILDKALQQEPEMRYQTAEEMLEEIRRLERALAPKKSAIASVDYEAFISYCHEEKSIQAAEQIQKMIERYKIPKSVQKLGGKTKMGKVFRDREELASSSDMEVHLKEALDHSEYLIVLLSPKVPESPWVNREIELFLQTHDRDHVLTILVDGELDESFPEYLRKSEKFDNGQMKMVSVESLAADIRGNDKKERKQRLKTEIFRLLAPMLGCGYDDLRQRQKEYRMQRILRLSLAGMFVFGIIAVYVGWQAAQIQKNYWETLTKQSRYLADVSSELLTSGDRIKALQVALEALPERESDKSKPRTAEAEAALANALYAYQGVNSTAYSMQADYQVKMETKSSGQERLSPSGKSLLTLDGNNTLYVWNTEDGALLKKWDSTFWRQQGVEADVVYCEFLTEDVVLILTEKLLIQMRILDETVLLKEVVQGDFAQYYVNSTYCALSASREYLAVFEDTSVDSFLTVYQVSDGKMVYQVSLKNTISEALQFGYATDIQFSPDSRYVALTFRTYLSEEPYEKGLLLVVDIQENFIHTVVDGEVSYFNCCFTADEKILVFGCEPMLLLSSYDLECPGKIKCYDLKKPELLWEKDLSCQMGDNGKSGLLEDKENGVIVLWFDRQIMILDADTGEVLRNPKSDEYISNVCYRRENNYIVGLQDGSIWLLGGENTFLKLGTNVEKETSNMLFHEDTFSAYLISEEDGTVVGMKILLDSKAKNVELENKIYGISTYEDRPYYVVYSYADEKGERDCVTVYESETDEKKLELYTEGHVNSDIWLRDEKTYCYVQYTSGESFSYETIIAAYDMEKQEELWQLKPDISWSDVEFFSIGEGEEFAVCQYPDSVKFLDLTTGKWLEEETIELILEEPQDGYVSQESFLSKDGRYLVVLDRYNMYTKEDYTKLRVYDRQKNGWLELAQEIENLKLSDTYKILWLAEESNLLALYEEETKELAIVDIEKNSVIQKIPFSGKDVRNVQFMNHDKSLLLWSDNSYLRLWDIEKACITMEDTQRLYQVSSISVSEENDLIIIRGIDEASMNLFLGEKWLTWIYLLEDGRFYPYVKILNGTYDDNADRICSIGEYQDSLHWFQRYPLDELLQMAREKVGNAVLSEADKVKYYIR